MSTKAKSASAPARTGDTRYTATSLRDISENFKTFAADLRYQTLTEEKAQSKRFLEGQAFAYETAANILAHTTLVGVVTFGVRIGTGPVVGHVNAENSTRAATLARARFGGKAVVFNIND